MRKQGLIFLVALAGIILALYLIFSDRWIEKRMESLISRITGAKVEFDGVAFSLFRLQMGWDRLQVTDPDNTWKNLFETEQVEFDFALEPLFSKRFIIENFEVLGIKFNTDRQTDGSLPPRKRPRKKPKIVTTVEEKLQNELSRLPILNPEDLTGKVDVDALLDQVSPQTPEKIDSLKEDYIEIWEEWERRIGDLPGSEQLDELERELGSVKIETIDSPQEFKDSLSKLESLRRQATGYYAEIERMGKDFSDVTTDLEDVRNRILEWIDEDYRRIMEAAKLPDLSIQNIGKLLFGRKIIERIERILNIIAKIRFYMAKVSVVLPKKELPPRMAGQNIAFERERELPKFWIKRIALSGVTQRDVLIEGNIDDIVSQQRIINKPTVFTLRGERPDGAQLEIGGALDNRSEPSSEQFSLTLRRLPLKGVDLSDFPLLPFDITEGTAAIEGKILFSGSDFTSEVTFDAMGVRFDSSKKPSNMNEWLYKVARSVALSIDQIQFTASVQQVEGEFSFSVQSNLDTLISQSLREVVSDELESVRRRLEERIMMEVDPKVRNLENLINEREEFIADEISGLEQSFFKQLDVIEKKRKEIESILAREEEKLRQELEERAKEEQERLEKLLKEEQKELEEEVKDKLRDLF